MKDQGQNPPFYSKPRYRLVSGHFGSFMAGTGVYITFFTGPPAVLPLVVGVLRVVFGGNMVFSAFTSKESWPSKIGPLLTKEHDLPPALNRYPSLRKISVPLVRIAVQAVFRIDLSRPAMMGKINSGISHRDQFHLALKEYRKTMFVLRDLWNGTGESLQGITCKDTYISCRPGFRNTTPIHIRPRRSGADQS